MRFLATILSLYFLGLAIIPCSDAENSPKSEEQYITEHSSHQNSADDCAPFCSCQCCQSQLTLSDIPVFEPQNPEFHINPIFYRNNSGKEFLTSPFQPPIV